MRRLTTMKQEASTDEWLSGGETIVFCSETLLAQEVHSLLCSKLPRLQPMLLTEGVAPKERIAAIEAVQRGDSQLLVCCWTCQNAFAWKLHGSIY